MSKSLDLDWLADAGVPPLGDPRLSSFLAERGLSGEAQIGIRWGLFLRLTGWRSRELAAHLQRDRRPPQPGARGELVDLIGDVDDELAEELGPKLDSLARTVRRYIAEGRRQLGDAVGPDA